MMAHRWVRIMVMVTVKVRVRAYICSGFHTGPGYWTGCSTSQKSPLCGLGKLKDGLGFGLVLRFGLIFTQGPI